MPAESECEEPFKGRSCSKGSRVRTCTRNRPDGVKKFRKSSELEDDIKPDPLTEVLSPLVETDQPLYDAIQASNLTPTSSQNSDIVADISRQEKPINLFIDEQEGISPQSCTETDFEMKTSNLVLFLLISVVSVHFRAIDDETIPCQA